MQLSTFEQWRVAATLPYRVCAEITTLMREQNPYSVWFSCRHKSYPVQCEYSLKL